MLARALTDGMGSSRLEVASASVDGFGKALLGVSFESTTKVVINISSIMIAPSLLKCKGNVEVDRACIIYFQGKVCNIHIGKLGNTIPQGCIALQR